MSQSLLLILIAVVALALIIFIVFKPKTSAVQPMPDADARRFARLLVAEIKLYNAQQIEEGRRSKDLYRRMRKEIDRARQMYDQRIPKSIEAADHLHDEIVNTLAGGDPGNLGADYTGPEKSGERAG
jgi:hypothetical protein